MRAQPERHQRPNPAVASCSFPISMENLLGARAYEVQSLWLQLPVSGASGVPCAGRTVHVDSVLLFPNLRNCEERLNVLKSTQQSPSTNNSEEPILCCSARMCETSRLRVYMLSAQADPKRLFNNGLCLSFVYEQFGYIALHNKMNQ